MNILAIGDIVGSTGTEMFLEKIDELKEKYSVDFCIVNGENASENNGITRRTAEKLLSGGADMITLGNHAFRQKDAYSLLHNEKRIIRPANFPEGTSGSGVFQTEKNGKTIAVINLLGRVYLDYMDCPFKAVDDILKKITADIIIVDFHAEATSEKISMGWYLDGRVSAVFGTHTHVITADEKIMPKGTGYITDIGMTGPYYSCLGVKKEITLARFKSCIPQRFEFADGAAQLNGVLFKTDEKTNKTTEIEKVIITP